MADKNTGTDASVPGKTKVQLLTEKRETLRAEIAQKREAQLEIDLEAILQLEIEHGAEQLTVLDLSYAEGSAVKVAVLAPDDFKIKAYRQFLKSSRKANSDGEADTTGAAIQIGQQCVVYPRFGSELYRATIAAHAGVEVQLGTSALHLSAGLAESLGKG